MAQGAKAVAVTGSLARGDWAPGSDVDLWVLTEEDGRRELGEGTLAVTWLCQRPATATAFDSLCLFEVDELQVLADPQRLFEQVRATYATCRADVARALFSQTVLHVLAQLAGAESGAEPARVRRLRDVALRIATLELFLRHGRRVAKLRHLRRTLPGPAWGWLRSALGLPWPPSHWRRVLGATLPSYQEARWLRKDTPLPDKWLSLRTHQPDDAALGLRRHFEEQVVAPLADRGLSLTPSLAAHRALLAGLPQVPGRALRATSRAVERLCETLEVRRYLRPAAAWRAPLRRSRQNLIAPASTAASSA